MLPLRTQSLADDPGLEAVSDRLVEEAWPPYVLLANSPDIRPPGWGGLARRLPQHQLVFFEGDDAVAACHMAPLHLDVEVEDLPEEGWDWAMNRCFEERLPTHLCGLSVSIPPRNQGRGLAMKVLEAMRLHAGELPMVVPVRPSHKARHPRESIEEYLFRIGPDGLSSDPWLRVHQRLGGRIVAICHRAMTMTGSAKQWSRWTGSDELTDGEHVLPGLLVPLTVEAGVGTYVEPNVWVLHS